MRVATNGHTYAKQLLSNCGLDEITDLEMDLFVAGLDAMLIEEPLSNCDGKIIFGDKRAIIKIDSKIQFIESHSMKTDGFFFFYILHKK